jgi:hypothetical protein
MFQQCIYTKIQREVAVPPLTNDPNDFISQQKICPLLIVDCVDRHLCGKQAGKQLEKREDLLRVAGLYDAAEPASGGELPRHGC